MADGLDPERVHWALAHPLYGPWLRALVNDIAGFSATGADEYWWKPEDEPRIRELVDEALGDDGPTDHRREGKNYPGAMVEEVVRQATIAQRNGKNLGRTLRNELYPKIDGATTYAVDAIFRLMKRGMLADAGRKGWLKVAGDSSATTSFINLLELESRS